MLRTSQENEHTTSFGTCSEPVCRAITYAEAADPSGCGHGVEVWPASGDKKGGVRFPYRVARKPPAESTLHKPWGTGKRGAYPRERGEKMVEVVESYGVRSDCGSNPLKDGPVGWKVGRHRGRSMRLLGSGGDQNQGLRPGILETPGMACQGFSGPGMAGSDGHWGLWPNWLSGLERMRSGAYSLESHDTKGPWSLESWLEDQVGKRPSVEKGHSWPAVQRASLTWWRKRGEGGQRQVSIWGEVESKARKHQSHAVRVGDRASALLNELETASGRIKPTAGGDSDWGGGLESHP